jgi:hypothetical protein
MTACTLCHQPMRWVETRNGSWLPLDAEPDPLHGTVFVHGEEATMLQRQDLRRARIAREELYRLHWETCDVAIRIRQEMKGKGR